MEEDIRILVMLRMTINLALVLRKDEGTIRADIATTRVCRWKVLFIINRTYNRVTGLRDTKCYDAVYPV